MFKTRDFLPVIITALIVIILAVFALAQSGECTGNWICWFVAPLQILFGQYQTAHAGSPQGQFLLTLTQIGGKAILLVGAFLSSVRLIISAVRHDFRTAMARRMKSHTIVCGLGETGMQVVRNLLAARKHVVVIDRAGDTVNATVCEQQGVPVIKGDATNSDTLALAGVLHAQTVVICTGDDVSNMDVALDIRELVRDRRPTGSHDLLVLAEMRNRWLFSRLVNHNQYSLGSSGVELRLFNTNENAARFLLRSLKLPPGPEVSSGPFVIFGFGSLGQQVALHIIRAAPVTIGSKVKIVIFDRAAEQRQNEFLRTYPAGAKRAYG